jgi:hypothetical protein
MGKKQNVVFVFFALFRHHVQEILSTETEFKDKHGTVYAGVNYNLPYLIIS